MEQLNSLEKENEKYKRIIADLKSQIAKLKKEEMVYIGKKNDKLDTLLGKALNNYPEKDKMRILFLRESEGVYHFGSKRVYIKIGKGDQVLVRVGGGFMGVNEFIE